MGQLNTISKSLESIDYFESLNYNEIEKISTFFSEEKIPMGEPIIFSDKVPDFLRILIEGEVRQLINQPINNNTITLELHSPNYIVGLPSFQSKTPLELITAATDVTFLKIDTKDWLKILGEFPNILKKLNKRIYLIEIFTFIKDLKGINLPDKPKELRKILRHILSESEVIYLSDDNNEGKVIDEKKLWFVASNCNSFDYGKQIDNESFSIAKLDENLPIRLIGIPDLINNTTPNSIFINKPASITITPYSSGAKEIQEKLKIHSNSPIEHNISKDENDGSLKFNKYRFFSSNKDPIKEAIACFRIIAESLNIPIKVDLLQRSFVENINPENDQITLNLCAAIAESLGLKTQLLDLPLGLVNRIQTPSLIQ